MLSLQTKHILNSLNPEFLIPTHSPNPLINFYLSLHPNILYFFCESERKKVAQSCPTLCDPMDCSLPGSSMSGIFQASGKEPVCKSRRERHGSIPGSGRAPRGGRGSPLQSSCLENPMDTGAWGAAVHGVAKGRTLSQHTHTGRPGVVRLSSLACFSLLQSFKGWGC